MLLYGRIDNSVRFPLRLNVNVAVDRATENVVRRANKVAQRHGFRAIMFALTDSDPSPHITLSRVWVEDEQELTVFRESWRRSTYDVLDGPVRSRLPLRIYPPELHTSRGPYLLARVVSTDARTRYLLQHFCSSPVGSLHMTIGASLRRRTLPMAKPLFGTLHAGIRSFRLSVQGPHGTSLETIEEAPAVTILG